VTAVKDLALIQNIQKTVIYHH